MSKDLKFVYEFSIHGFYFVKIIFHSNLFKFKTTWKTNLVLSMLIFISLVLFTFICNSLLGSVFISDIIQLSALILIKYVKHILVGLNDIQKAY